MHLSGARSSLFHPVNGSYETILYIQMQLHIYLLNIIQHEMCRKVIQNNPAPPTLIHPTPLVHLRTCTTWWIQGCWKSNREFPYPHTILVTQHSTEHYTTINQTTAGRFDPRVFVNCLPLTKTLGSKRPAVVNASHRSIFSSLHGPPL